MISNTPKFCAECGAPLSAGAKFCAGCGHQVTAAEIAAAAKQDGGAASAEPKAAAPVAAKEPEKAVEKPAPAVAAPAPAAPAKKSSLPKASQDDHADEEDHHHARHSGGHFDDPIEHALHHTAEDDDQLGLPGGKVPKGPLPFGLIAICSLAALLAGIAAYIGTNAERKAAFQCHLLGQKDKCETDAEKQAKIDEAEHEQEQTLMLNRTGQFDLNFSPEDEIQVKIVQKRYEEDRKSYIGRITGSLPCGEKGECPTNYECQGAGKKEGSEAERGKCIAKSGIGDNRTVKEVRVGDANLGAPDKEGHSKATIGFVTEEAWKAKHNADAVWPVPPPPPPPPMPGEILAPAQPPLPPPPAGPFTLRTTPQKKAQLPMSLQTLPLLDKEQCAPVSADKDAKCDRLTAEKVKDIEKRKETPKKDADGNIVDDPTTHIKTTDLSTYVYEIELWAPGYKARKVLFYEDPAPSDIDPKKLEKEGWTVRKFKKTPDGKSVIDNASFDLTPEPQILRPRYLLLLKDLQCLRLTPDFKGKNEALKHDAEERLKEEKFFTVDKWEIAVKNNDDAEWAKYRDAELKAYKCPKPGE